MQTVQLQLTTVADNHNMFIMHCSLIYSWVSHRFKVDVRFKRISLVCVVCHIYIFSGSPACFHSLPHTCWRMYARGHSETTMNISDLRRYVIRLTQIYHFIHLDCVCVCFWTPHTVSHYECRVFDVQASIHDSLPWRRRPNHPPNKLRIWRS